MQTFGVNAFFYSTNYNRASAQSFLRQTRAEIWRLSMSQPKSFLQMTGAPAHPSPLDRSALVLIDIQREYSDGAVPLARVQDAAIEAAKALELARRHNVPVFHIAH